MQNLPGLSFFDGLTRSRTSPSTSNTARSASAASPPDTPLRDAAPFASLRSHSHPLGGSESGIDYARETSETFDDPLSPSGTALPAASFSRRAASVSAASSPVPGLPARRTSGNTTATRSSILSKDSIFSAPILNRRPSSIAENSTSAPLSSPATGGRERSSSFLGRESTEPTAKDVALMALGTQAFAMLKRIQEHPIELADIIRLLVTKKAILILPTYSASTDDPVPQRAYYEDHVIIPESNSGESLFVTLSGIRGILKPVSSSIALLGLATGQDFGNMVSDASGPTKRSFFDNMSKFEGATSTKAEHELELVNSSRKPVVIFVESVGSVQALLVDKMIPHPEGEETPTPIVPLASGIQSVRDRSAARRTASSASSVRSMSFAEEKGKDAIPLPKLPKIASDVPLEWDNMIRDLERYLMVVKLRKSPLPNADRYANEFQRKYDEVRHRFEAYGSASGMSNRWTELDFDEVQQWVEAWLCREMYPAIFPQSADGPNSEDYLQDEQLQAKIAALNFLDLTLEHLGFVLEHPEDVEHIAQVVREGGVEMQKLALVKSPTDKMNVILSSHRVVVDALNREPAVQGMLAEADQTMETPAVATSTNTGDAASVVVSSAGLTSPVTELKSADSKPSSPNSTKSKRLSMPKIMMDGDVPRINSPLSPGLRQPRIPMDEGYERRSQADDDESVSRPVSSSETAETTEMTLTSISAGAELKQEDTKGDAKEETTTEVNPASIELPMSPTPAEESSTLSIVVPEVVETTSESTPDISLPALTSSRKHYSADVLLPLLIFSVVKSNPPMLISNLRYIQRFKVQDHLTGELAYCLTNMMAVVSFLEELDPQAFGLSSDIRVLSDLSDIHANTGRPNPTAVPLRNFQEGFDHTKALGHKVSQELVGVAEEGLKVISDVVQDGYSKFFGRFLTTSDGSTPFGGSIPRGQSQTRGTRSLSAASSLVATAAAAAAASVTPANSLEEERKRRATAVSNAMANALPRTGSGLPDEKSRISGLVSPAGVTSNVSTVSVDGSAGSIGVEKSSPHDSAMEAATRNRVLDFLRTAEGPQIQFMACTNSGDLRLSDIKGLLEDYQRIGKMLEQAKRLA
ncbi:hypothetical protein BGZ96_011822 [Linnemannia gamsii]|uniref:VPS9 domain-containing protein n=1 Tax=Linnemannia gamsii TaxID=64522 RepID=A0ABQ7JRW4_9FUNG|nr:hypothetical protein BGZ96_011822 [Linnemannia gamsii]